MATIVAVKKKAGSRYAVSNVGAEDIQLKYQVVFSAPVDCATELPATFSAGGVAVPSIGSEHPDREGYFASKYEISQPEGAAKNTLDVVVKYTPNIFEVGEGQQPEIINDIEEWGWDDSTTDRELLTDMDGNPVVNSAGDVFASVPSVESPSPTFTKVMNFKSRQSGWGQYLCTVNQSAVTIGGISFDPRTLLCTVSEKLNIGNAVFPYRYTVKLRYRSNKVKLAQANTETECGWDVALTDAGMREKVNGKLKIIQVESAETGEMCNVSTPELLDGQGSAVARSGSGEPPEPYNFRFKAYAAATWPSWFYSEPTIAAPAATSNGGNAQNNGGNS